MPYTIKQVGGEWCVYKQEGGSPVGDALGCHALRDDAVAQIAAIESSENTKSRVYHYVPAGVMSFAQLEQVAALNQMRDDLENMNYAFGEIMWNIIYSQLSIGDKKALLNAAVADFSAAIDKVAQESPEVKDASSPPSQFNVYKDVDGVYRWIAVYSNNLRDLDNPSDIISKAAHLGFVERLQKGSVPFPVLYHWHLKDTVWGDSDMVSVVPTGDPDVVFLLATGTVREGHENEALALSQKSGIGVSHGMTNVAREQINGQNVITYYDTFEISDLPLEWAANPYTDFSVKGQDMPLPQPVKTYLAGLGLDTNAIEQVSKAIDSKAADALQSGVAFKSQPPTDDAQPPAIEPPASQPPAADTAAQAVNPADLEKAIGSIIAKAVEAAIEPVVGILENVVADNESIKALIGATPVAGNPIGDSATRVDGRTALSKAAPQLPNDQKAAGFTDFPQLDAILSEGVPAIIAALQKGGQ